MAIAEFEYGCAMKKDALLKIDRIFGQLQVLVRAYLKNLTM